MSGRAPARAGPAAGNGGSLDGLAELIARLRRAMRRAARAAQPENQLSVAQLELLTVVGGRPGIRPGDVAATLRMAPNSVSTLANGLEAVGMLVRAAGIRDRRAVEFSLTAAGAAAVQAWQATNAMMLDAALAGLGDDDRAALAGAVPALGRLVDRLEEGSREPPPDRSVAVESSAKRTG